MKQQDIVFVDGHIENGARGIDNFREVSPGMSFCPTRSSTCDVPESHR